MFRNIIRNDASLELFRALNRNENIIIFVKKLFIRSCSGRRIGKADNFLYFIHLCLLLLFSNNVPTNNFKEMLCNSATGWTEHVKFTFFRHHRLEEVSVFDKNV